MIMYYSGSESIGNLDIGFKINMLHSYYGIQGKKLEKLKQCKRLFLDSGAFSAWTQKDRIDLEKYMKYIHKYKKEINVYAALDDITSYEISLKNYKIMLEDGLKPLPAFHYGEPFSVIDEYLKHTNYIALGGIAKLNKRERNIWLETIFSKFPDPKKVGFHGFGIQDRDIIQRYPWKSVDASSWHVMARYGGVCTPWGDIKINIHVQYHNLRWLTPQAELKLKEWIESMGRDYELAKQETKEGSQERMLINILYYEELSKKCPKYFKNPSLQRTLFGV